jgi:transcriptional regulator with XRE-family HTH domain
MAGKEPDIGTTARTVAANVQRLRQARDMNYKALSERLQEVAQWSVNAVGIRRIEAGERRVTPDDLMALAVALDVSPVTLLMPNTQNPKDQVSITGVPGEVEAERLWEWLAANVALKESGEWVEFIHEAWPSWKVRSLYEAAAARSAEENRLRQQENLKT